MTADKIIPTPNENNTNNISGIGDNITVETLDGTLTFEISEIQIVDPEDPYIYHTAEEPTITLVTCYPFIYMGPTPERYVVKAVLSK